MSNVGVHTLTGSRGPGQKSCTRCAPTKKLLMLLALLSRFLLSRLLYGDFGKFAMQNCYHEALMRNP